MGSDAKFDKTAAVYYCKFSYSRYKDTVHIKISMPVTDSTTRVCGMYRFLVMVVLTSVAFSQVTFASPGAQQSTGRPACSNDQDFDRRSGYSAAPAARKEHRHRGRHSEYRPGARPVHLEGLRWQADENPFRRAHPGLSGTGKGLLCASFARTIMRRLKPCWTAQKSSLSASTCSRNCPKASARVR